jgi:NADP-dependent alcohol dehydrogenase
MFYSYNPTKLIFGKGSFNRIKFEIKKDYRILLLTGKNFLKKYPIILENLKKQIKNKIFYFNNFTPNPDLYDCLEAIKFGKNNKINFIISLGGGSIVDAAKFCALFFYEPTKGWEFMEKKNLSIPKKFLNLGCIQTYPATGSESNHAFVISNNDTKQKLHSMTLNSYPKFSIMDTNLAKSLNIKQTNYGILDMFSHVLEQYVSTSDKSDLHEKYCLSLMIKIIENAYKIKKNLKSHDLRLENYWYASQAVNGTLSRMYAKNDWASHGIGHVLTSLYGLTHAETLALCIPRVFKFFSKEKQNRLFKLNNLVFLKFFNSSDSIKNLLKFINFLNIGYNFEDYYLNKHQVAQDLKNYFVEYNFKTGHDQKTIVNHKNIKSIINIKL